jgi:hypothetical protein
LFFTFICTVDNTIDGHNCNKVAFFCFVCHFVLGYMWQLISATDFAVRRSQAGKRRKAAPKSSTMSFGPLI